LSTIFFFFSLGQISSEPNSMSRIIKFEGHQYFRQRLILSALSGRIIRIDKIRSNDENPGLRGRITQPFKSARYKDTHLSHFWELTLIRKHAYRLRSKFSTIARKDHKWFDSGDQLYRYEIRELMTNSNTKFSFF
jgi:hypothetical protein